MLRFFVKLGILFASFLIFFAWAECRLSSMPSNYSVKRTLLEKNLTNIEVLVLGNSQTEGGIDPSLLAYHGLNMALGGESTYYDTQILLKWGRHLPRLKSVILPASYFLLEGNPKGPAERSVFYSRYYNIPPAQRRWLHPELHYFSLFATLGTQRSIDCLLKNRPHESVNPSGFTDAGWRSSDNRLSTDQVANVMSGVDEVLYHESFMDKKYIIRDLCKTLLNA